MVTQHVTLDLLPRARKILLLRQYRGLFALIAKRGGVSRSLVSRVYYGQAVSARVKTLLEEELSR